MRSFTTAPRLLAGSLLSSAALTGLMALHAAPVAAQVIPITNLDPVVVSSIQPPAPPPPQTVDQPGVAGAAGGDLTVELQTSQNIRTTADNSVLVSVTSKGGAGSNASYTDAGYGPSGPRGGAGGDGGAIGFTIDPPVPPAGGYTTLEAFGQNTTGVSLTSQGGDAGIGSSTGNRGNGGEGGDAGKGGTITAKILQNPTFPQQWNFIEAQSVGLSMASTGGRGGEAGATIADTDSVTGRKGGSGGDAGQITAVLNLNLQGQGYGVHALSQGGDGGQGGIASTAFGKATGASGGVAGQGGNIFLREVGGAIQAAGAATSGTGSDQSVDAYNGGTTTVETSASAAAILAESRGGSGGLGGLTNGAVTKGGPGALGGNGGVVNLSLESSGIGAYDNVLVGTTGYNAVGAMALSVGGDGGDGDSGGGVYYRKGGNGGPGGNGGIVTVVAGQSSVPYAKIITTGDHSDALVAVSIGGGGGFGGDVSEAANLGFDITIGGKGAYGGNGGQASVINNGDVITTAGDASRGAVVQSIGGGGGNGGSAYSGSLFSTIAIGGSGGTGGIGGEADMINRGLISTGGSHADGVFAQSVGGGGGTGGGAIAQVVGSQITVAIAVGGNGGTGGDAGNVEAYNLNQVQTKGANAHAVFAQSVGGGGGVGGTSVASTFAANVPDEPSLTLTTAVGGKGGSGGVGGEVDVLNTHLLATQGPDAYGVFAQSIGGGGGAGGDATATSTARDQSQLTVTTAIGGSGGNGTSGGAVNVWNSGLIMTSSRQSMGVFAQSVGGGGGDGGFGATNQGAYQAPDYSAAITVTVGGTGGKGGDGGAVTVNNYVDTNNFTNRGSLANDAIDGVGGIITMGDVAPGVFAQSIGGGGGNGGDAGGKGGNGQLSVNVAVGGAGGSGGGGGAVTVHNGTGAILTRGAQSYGVFAQSIGGGGGNGGQATTGSGDDPQYAYPEQAAGLINNKTGLIKDPGSITQVTDNLWDWKDNVQGAWGDITKLKNLYDINTSIDTSNPVENKGLKGADLTVDVGGGFAGAGGVAGNGGAVTLDSAGQIGTSGALAHGLFGQSVGGGGGTGGASAPASANDQLQVAAIQGALALGGRGGGGGDGGMVLLTNNGTIQTSGDIAFGLFSESVGGGGGVAGASTPNAGIGLTMAISVGASDGTSGSGEASSVVNNRDVATHGNNAIGMVAQSIGGGGGLLAVTGQLIDPRTGLGYSTAGGLENASIGIQLQDPGSNSKGGPAFATLASNASIATTGMNAFGILAQSIGGGGGLIIADPNNAAESDDNRSGPRLYASAGDTSYLGMRHNAANDATVSTGPNSLIQTSGDGAAGIVAQSIGGGGVIVNGLNGIDVTGVSHAAPGNRFQVGDGGNVHIDSAGTIITTGAYAHGIFAQAASAGGGIVGRTNGSGYVFRGYGGNGCSGGYDGSCTGLVEASIYGGSISVAGAHAFGVVLESQGNDFNNSGPGASYNEAHLTVFAGAKVEAVFNAEGAVLLNGVDAQGGLNLVDNAGLIDGSGSATGIAITTVHGARGTVNNTGLIKGQVLLGSAGGEQSGLTGTSRFNNLAGGTFVAGSKVDLGAGGVLANSGTIKIGGDAATGTTALTGDLVQTSGGVLVFRKDAATGKADLLTVSGTAAIGGTVALEGGVSRKSTVTVLTAAGGLTVVPTLLAAKPATSLFTNDLVVAGNALQITTNAHFTAVASSLGRNRQAVASYLQNSWDAGSDLGGGFGRLANGLTAANLAAGLDSLSGQPLGAIAAARYRSAQAFAGAMLDACPDGIGASGRCVWTRVTGEWADRGGSADTLGYSLNSQTYQMGVQGQIGENLLLGGTLGYESSDLNDAARAGHVSGNNVMAGVSLGYRPGAWRLSGALDVAHGDYRSTRIIAIGPDISTATAKPDFWDAGLHLRAGYQAALGKAWTLEPYATLHGRLARSAAYAETGSGLFNLAVDSERHTALSADAGALLRGSFNLQGTIIHPYASAAVEYLNSSDWAATVRFAGDTGGTGFAASTPLPTALGRFTAGVEVDGGARWRLKLQYGRDDGDNYRSQSASAHLAVAF